RGSPTRIGCFSYSKTSRDACSQLAKRLGLRHCSLEAHPPAAALPEHICCTSTIGKTTQADAHTAAGGFTRMAAPMPSSLPMPTSCRSGSSPLSLSLYHSRVPWVLRYQHCVVLVVNNKPVTDWGILGQGELQVSM
ncbi:unnamed protein product, partial [Urochloa humidicola]